MARHATGSVIASAGVAAIAMGFVGIAALLTASNVGPRSRLEATFSSSNGLVVGSAVQVSGIVVGKVSSIELDSRTLSSRVRFTVSRGLDLPDDSRLAVQGMTSGSAILDLQPGHSSRLLNDGETVVQTSPPESLEESVGDYIFGNGGLSEPK